MAMRSEWFPCVDIRHMHLNEGDINTGQGIPNSHAGVGQGPGVDDDGRHLFPMPAVPRSYIGTPASSLLNAVDNGAFVVGLECFQLKPQTASLGPCLLFDVRKRS